MEQKPYGRDQVREAIITAARGRFAREGLSASLRDIAGDANVNLGLVHRHFGSKDALVAAVLSGVAQGGYERIAGTETLQDALAIAINGTTSGNDSYVRMVAWIVLSGADPVDFQDRFPTIGHIAALAGDEHRQLVLLTLAATFGWQLFGHLLSTAVGYESDAEGGADLADLLHRLAATLS